VGEVSGNAPDVVLAVQAFRRTCHSIIWRDFHDSPPTPNSASRRLANVPLGGGRAASARRQSGHVAREIWLHNSEGGNSFLRFPCGSGAENASLPHPVRVSISLR
jgi:hypothetical protein